MAESARGAAFDDSRFSPVTRDEARGAESLPQHPLAAATHSADQVEIGRHGLLISLGLYRGLLLPQVPVEHGWDRISVPRTNLQEGRIAADAWQTGAKLEAFTAEVFADPNM